MTLNSNDTFDQLDPFIDDKPSRFKRSKTQNKYDADSVKNAITFMAEATARPDKKDVAEVV